MVEAADEAGLKLAVNQNGRWCPPLRAATLLVAQGAIGDVVAVTHLHDKNMPPVVGLHFDELDHFVIYDYDVHWIDISRCWLDGDRPVEVRAADYRVPGQPDNARNPWGANVEIRWATGANVLIRTVGDARTLSRGRAILDPRHRGHDPRQRPARLGLPRARPRRRGRAVPLEGAW